MSASKWPSSAAQHSSMSKTTSMQPQTKQMSVFEPTYSKMENVDYASTQRLKEAFCNVEKQCPGFSQDFVISLLYRVGLNNEADIWETSLRISGLQENYVQRNPRRPYVAELESRAMTLKLVLSSIPNEIIDRRSFIELIKDVANAIKELLATVMPFYESLQSGSQKRALEEQKRQFVIYCRKFSATLKDYFRDNNQKTVYNSANRLVTQINLIILLVREME